jgi:heterodisulfide reductase subunit A
MVLVSGCHFSDCHYINAVQWTQKRVEKLWNRLDKLGIRPERLQLEYISAAQGNKFAKVMTDLDRMRKFVTLEEIEESKKILDVEMDKVSARKEKTRTKVFERNKGGGVKEVPIG